MAHPLKYKDGILVVIEVFVCLLYSRLRSFVRLFVGFVGRLVGSCSVVVFDIN